MPKNNTINIPYNVASYGDVPADLALIQRLNPQQKIDIARILTALIARNATTLEQERDYVLTLIRDEDKPAMGKIFDEFLAYARG